MIPLEGFVKLYRCPPSMDWNLFGTGYEKGLGDGVGVCVRQFMRGSSCNPFMSSVFKVSLLPF